MIIEGKEIGITKQPFSILKKNVCDDAKDLDDMIKRIKDFEMSMDEKMQEIEVQPIFQTKVDISQKSIKDNTIENIESNNSAKDEKTLKNITTRSLFTKETLERIGQIKSPNDMEREA